MTQLKDIDREMAEILFDNVINKRGKLTYKEIAEALSKQLGREINPHYGLRNSLVAVSMLCFELGLPLISARVIYSGATTSSQAAGEGFYSFACDLRPEYKDLLPGTAWKNELNLIRECKNWHRLKEYLDGVPVSRMLNQSNDEPNVNESESIVHNEDIEPFTRWLLSTTQLSENSIKKYSGAVNTISNEMMGLGVIKKSLTKMIPIEIDLIIAFILHNEKFIEKNTRGNNMYSNALKQYRYYVHSMDEQTLDDTASLIETIQKDSTISKTECSAIVLSRIGQGAFRKLIMDKYNGRCIITGIDQPKLLVASHIKPWVISTNKERLSVDNGLLLSATYDRLFDCGLITFDKVGKIYLSSFIGADNIKRLHLAKNMHFNLYLSGGMEKYLEFHNDVIFVK